MSTTAEAVESVLASREVAERIAAAREEATEHAARVVATRNVANYTPEELATEVRGCVSERATPLADAIRDLRADLATAASVAADLREEVEGQRSRWMKAERDEHGDGCQCFVCALRDHVEALEAWQLAVADGMGYVNRAEGQGGYEVAAPSVILGAWAAQQERIERAEEVQASQEDRARELIAEAEADRAAAEGRVVDLEARHWVQCTSASNECLGGCASLNEHDRYRHAKLKEELLEAEASAEQFMAERDDLRARNEELVAALASMEQLFGYSDTQAHFVVPGNTRVIPALAAARAALAKNRGTR